MDQYYDIQLEKNQKTPMFEQIVSQITDKIKAGIIVPGSKLPAERNLAAHLGISRGTVKKAYELLEDARYIKTIQGSGCYVLNNWEALSQDEKGHAFEILKNAFEQVKNLGLSQREVQNLTELYFTAFQGKRPVNIALIAASKETLVDFKHQLSYLAGTSISVFITESITLTQNAQTLLKDFDIIIVSSFDYEAINALLPNLKNKMVRAAVSLSPNSFLQIMALDKESKIGILARTGEFLEAVQNTLISLGFPYDNLLSYFEQDYTTKTYFPQRIDALITFKDSTIFTDPSFEFRNREFVDRGGKLIKFEYSFDRGTLIYIEDKINELLNQPNPTDFPL